MAARNSKGQFVPNGPKPGGAGGTSAKVTLLGVRSLKKKLRRLSSQGMRKALRAGVGRAVAILRKAIRAEVPGHAKSIKKAVGSKVKVNKKVGVVAKVGINVGKKSGRGHAPHGAIYVLGTSSRQTKSGKSTGRMPANNVVQRGVAAGEAQAQRELVAKIREVIKQEARKR